MVSDNATNDLWSIECFQRDKPSSVRVTIETREDVSPLDRQFGVINPRTYPDEVQDILFGIPEEQGEAPVHLYAILDAATVPDLVDFLETSELPHACLIQGDSFAELGDVAPWIVQLQGDCALTRRLFTDDPKVRWSLWDKDAALLVRSAANLEDLTRHFRKMLRINDDDARWFYFRFWAHSTLVDYVQAAQDRDADAILPVFASRRAPVVEALICTKAPTSVTVCRLSEDSLPLVAERAGRIDAGIVKDLALTAHIRNFVSDFHRLQGHNPSSEQCDSDVSCCAKVVRHFVSLGFKSRYHLGSFVYWTLFTQARIDTLSPVIQSASQAIQDDPNARFAAMAREIKRLFGPRVRNHHGG